MKGQTVILLCFVVSLCLVQACAAIVGEGQVTTTPTDVTALKPGDQVSEVTGTVLLPTSGDTTFNSDDSVDFYTQLTGASWSVSIVLNGITNPPRTFGGSHATIGGYDLSYPTANYNQVELQYTLTGGTVPTTFTTGNVILVRCLELDPNSDQVGQAYFVNGTVFNTAELQPEIDSLNAKLSALQADINAKVAMGVTVDTARQNYNSASSALQSATNNLISSPTQVQPLLDTATSSIDAANIALGQAWADYSIQQAKTMVNSVDGLITEFTVNDSLKTSDPRLVAIINKRDLAAQDISNANDLLAMNNSDSARAKANDGLTLANQAWNLSLDLKTELGQGFQFPGLPNLSAFLPVLLVIVVVGIVAGIIVYRKRTKWDELG